MRYLLKSDQKNDLLQAGNINQDHNFRGNTYYFTVLLDITYDLIVAGISKTKFAVL